MSVRYILGRSGAGKTHFCLQEIAKAQEKQGDHPLIWIVPEQFSLQSEKDLIAATPQKGLMRAQVLSFQRLAYRIFEEIGGTDKKILNDIGKTMVLRKIVEDVEPQLTVFHKAAKQMGFMESLGESIGEFYQYDISPEALKQSQQLIQEKPALRNKLNDLYIIYEAYRKFVEREFVTTEETLDLLAQRMESSKYLEGAEVWIDGFHGFTPQEYRVLYKLMRKVSRLHITLTVDPKQYITFPLQETDPFYETKRTIDKLNKMTALYHIELDPPVRLQEDPLPRFRQSPALDHLEKQYFQYPAKEYGDQIENIQIFAAANRYSEVEEVARKIIRLVRDQNKRFKQIAVVSRGVGEYQKYIKGIFQEFGIPYFIDRKKDILAHPLVELVRSALEILIRNWSYESVFRYLKTTLAGLYPEEVDILENYVLAYGIKGSKWQQEQWTYGMQKDLDEDHKTAYDEEKLERLHRIREKLLAPLRPLQQGFKKSRMYTVREITIALFELLERLHIETTLGERIQDLRSKNQLQAAREAVQIWEAMVEVFEKLIEILGDEKVDLDQYGKMLESGLSQCDIGLVPPGLDQVIVGDLERSRLPDIKVLFVVGANDGVLPAPVEELGLFSDMERLYMDGLGIELAPDGRRKVFEEQFLIYAGITKPTERLHFSYALGDVDGKAMRPSMLLGRLKKVFPHLSEESDIHTLEEQEIELITGATPTFHYLATALRRYVDHKQMHPLWQDVLSWYMGSDHWKDKTVTTIKGLFHTNQENYIAPETVKKLYGTEIYSSVSRLERFVVCPFAYFVQYGLKAKERKMYQLQTPDIGRLFHKVLDDFASRLEEQNLSWRGMDRKQCEEMVEKTVDELAPKLGHEILLSSARHRYLIERLKRITKRAVWALTEHIKRGTFEPLGFEIGFGHNEKLPPIVMELPTGERMILTGRIDRVDILDKDNQAYIKIMDYKSGSKAFNLLDIYYGMQLQLLLYLDAFLKTGQKLVSRELLPGGIFYFKIDDPMVSSVKTMSQEEIEDMLLKKLKLSGLVLADPEIVKEMDQNIKGYSDILPLQLTKDGAFSKNSSVATKEEFEQLRNYVQNIVLEIGQEILQGNVKISPYKNKTQKACDYCLYGSVCQFDPLFRDNQYRSLKPMKKEEIWEKLKEKRAGKEE